MLKFLSIFCISRSPIFGGGELGGNPIPKKISAACFFGFWILYVVMSALEQYCHIAGF